MNKLKINNFTIGSDPEAFLWSTIYNKFVPVCGLVGGTKENPLKVTDEGHALQEDNCMIEYCIPPSNNVDKFLGDINFMKSYINNTVLNKYDCVLKCVGSARFNMSDLQHPQAREFGCSPDFNAWTMSENTVGTADPELRSAGAHIHIGYDNPNTDTSIALIQAMDLFLGLQSLFLDPDDERRKLYGKAGAFRFKPYGVEYRVLSAFWTDNDELIKWAFNTTKQAIDFVNSGGIITNPDDIIKAINNNDKELAEEILFDYNIDIYKLNLIAA